MVMESIHEIQSCMPTPYNHGDMLHVTTTVKFITDHWTSSLKNNIGIELIALMYGQITCHHKTLKMFLFFVFFNT